MQIAFGRVRRKTSPAREYVQDCYSLKCQHIFGLYYKRSVQCLFNLLKIRIGLEIINTRAVARLAVC